MHICGAKFQEHCFNISRDIFYSVFNANHHWSNLHNIKRSISLKRKKIFQKEKRNSFVFQNAFQISRKKHFHVIYTLIISLLTSVILILPSQLSSYCSRIYSLNFAISPGEGFYEQNGEKALQLSEQSNFLQ